MTKKQRKQPTLKERMTPCIICLHPLSQKHHLLSFAKYGELHQVGTIQLCANCHDLYHLFERYARKKQQDVQIQLFDAETQEEKLIEELGSRPEYRSLVYLASAVVFTDEVVLLENEFRSNADKDRLDKNLSFIVHFEQYVQKERKKRDDQYRAIFANGFFSKMTSSNNDPALFPFDEG